MSATVKSRMTVDEFLAWSVRQPEGSRHELVDGEVVAMAPERVRHNLVKLAVARALGDAVAAAGLRCTVFTDGVGVAINCNTVREPDASVQCGITPDLESMTIASPVIVVEVSSPSSERDDTHTKLIDYFAVPSICHYLIVSSVRRVVVHHRRTETGIDTTIIHGGDLTLDPPGLTVPVTALLGPERRRDAEESN